MVPFPSIQDGVCFCLHQLVKTENKLKIKDFIEMITYFIFLPIFVFELSRFKFQQSSMGHPKIKKNMLLTKYLKYKKNKNHTKKTISFNWSEYRMFKRTLTQMLEQNIDSRRPRHLRQKWCQRKTIFLFTVTGVYVYFSAVHNVCTVTKLKKNGETVAIFCTYIFLNVVFLLVVAFATSYCPLKCLLPCIRNEDFIDRHCWEVPVTCEA